MVNRENEPSILEEKDSSDVKFCMTAIIDLIGFSSQLDVTYRDLTSIIGETLISRLLLLDNSLKLLKAESEEIFDLYPKDMNVIRINDSLIFTIDFDDFYKPRVGELHKYSFQINIDSNKGSSLKRFNEEYESKTQPIAIFLGVICRIHNYINNADRLNGFPGCKTIISTGFRKKFLNFIGVEDPFSANFSFSNAYLADKHLKGHNFFIDSNILGLLYYRESIFKSLISNSVYIKKPQYFDVINKIKSTDKNLFEGKLHIIELFHQNYYFQEVSPEILSYLQLVIVANDFLTENHYENKVPAFREKFEAIRKFDAEKAECLRVNAVTINSILVSEIIFLLIGWNENEKKLNLPSFKINKSKQK